jgi:adenylate cyclase
VRQLFPAIWGQWMTAIARPDFPTAHHLGGQLLNLARDASDPALFVQAHHALGPTHSFAGQWAAALEHFEQAVAHYDPGQHHAQALSLYGGHDPGVCCHTMAALSLWMLGYPDQALRRDQKAIELARELAHPVSLAHVLLMSGLLHQFRKDVSMTLERAEALQAIYTKQELAFHQALGMLVRGWALAELGRAEDGLQQIRQGLAMFHRTSPVWCGYGHALLAEAYGKRKEHAAGLAELDEALRCAEQTGMRQYEPEMHRLKGEFLLALGPEKSADGEGCFRQAIAIARRQGATALELRAVMSLSRLHVRQGRTAEARQMLAGCYGQFTEGFDTPDLREAQALLQAVSGG